MQRFKPSNQLTFDTVPKDSERLRKQIIASTSEKLKLDLSDVTQCDSAGLALLIEAKRLCKKHKLLFEIEGMSKTIHALAEFCGVNMMLAV